SLLFQVVDQWNKRIETDDLGALGNKVGKGVDVVEVGLAVAIIDDVFHTAHFDPRGLHDAFHRTHNVVRRGVAFHAQSGLRSVHGAGSALQVLAAGSFADVGRAQIKCIAGQMDLDAVQITATHDFDADDMASARGYELLHQSR